MSKIIKKTLYLTLLIATITTTSMPMEPAPKRLAPQDETSTLGALEPLCQDVKNEIIDFLELATLATLRLVSRGMLHLIRTGGHLLIDITIWSPKIPAYTEPDKYGVLPEDSSELMLIQRNGIIQTVAKLQGELFTHIKFFPNGQEVFDTITLDQVPPIFLQGAPLHQRKMYENAYKIKKEFFKKLSLTDFNSQLQIITQFFGENRPISLHFNMHSDLPFPTENPKRFSKQLIRYLGNYEIRKLYLMYFLGRIEDLVEASFIPKLQVLDLEENWEINDQFFMRILEKHGSLPRLQNLSVYATGVGDDGARWLTSENLPNLHTIDIIETDISIDRISTLPNLQSLTLSIHNCETLGELIQTGIITPKLRDLFFLNLDATPKCIHELMRIDLTNLRSLGLNLKNIPFTTMRLTNLHILNIFTNLATKDVEYFLNSLTEESLPSLHILEVKKCHINHDEIERLRPLIREKLPTLRKLVLYRETITFAPADATSSD